MNMRPTTAARMGTLTMGSGINPRRRMVAALPAALVLWTSGANAGAADEASPGAAQPRTESQQLAGELLGDMAKFLAALPGFEVSLVGSYDAVQDSGQKIEFNEVRRVAVARPDRLRMEQTRSDGEHDLVVFDGKTLTVLNGELDVFAQAPQPGSIDDSVVYFVRDLGMRLPLAALLTSRLPAELETRVKAVDYVEYTEILPVPAHHIAARTDTVDFQVWIADGDKPLPLRVVLTYVNEPGQPQFRAQFLDWRLQPPAGADMFRFDPPKDSRQIAFAVQVPAIAGASPAAPVTESTGVQP